MKDMSQLKLKMGVHNC